MHFDVVLDLGYDYGADGGLSWDTQIVAFPNGRTRRNQNRSVALGQWQLGNRTIDGTKLDYLQGFLHAMRGRVHSFLYHDWNDYRVVEQQLAIDGEDETQLIKVYGLDINGWVRDITKPKAASVVIEYNDGGGWEVLELDTDYTLDATTGILTWLMTAPASTSEQVRWSGEFRVPVRFDRDTLSAQFLGLEDRDEGPFAAYSVGSLAVVEEPEV